MKKLTKNAIKCKSCGDVIESKHRHDFVECSCKACFVDGGLDYQRIGAAEKDGFINLSEWEEDDV